MVTEIKSKQIYGTSCTYDEEFLGNIRSFGLTKKLRHVENEYLQNYSIIKSVGKRLTKSCDSIF